MGKPYTTKNLLMDLDRNDVSTVGGGGGGGGKGVDLNLHWMEPSFKMSMYCIFMHPFLIGENIVFRQLKIFAINFELW